MSIKITDKVRGPQVEGPSTELDDVPAVAQKEAADSPGRVESSTNNISIVAERLALGEITRDEAVSSILETVLESADVDSAPPELKLEISKALNSLIETDPYLLSLVHSLDS